MKPGETPVAEEILTLDPREYQVLPATISEDCFRRRREHLLPVFQKMGRRLNRLGGLPLQEEPLGSGELVTSGNFSIRDGSGFFITGSGENKSAPQAESILFVEKVDYTRGTIHKMGSAVHSRETLIH